MNKKILIIFALLSLVFLSACNGKTDSAYFDMDCNEDCNACTKQVDCDNICDNSGIRINNYKHKNEVMFEEGKFICKCY